jgi:hypothetical protein
MVVTKIYAAFFLGYVAKQEIPEVYLFFSMPGKFMMQNLFFCMASILACMAHSRKCDKKIFF